MLATAEAASSAATLCYPGAASLNGSNEAVKTAEKGARWGYGMGEAALGAKTNQLGRNFVLAALKMHEMNEKCAYI